MGDGTRTRSKRITTSCAKPLHYAHHGGSEGIRTLTFNALIVVPLPLDYRPSEMVPHAGIEPAQLVSKTSARNPAYETCGSSGGIRTLNILILSETPLPFGPRSQDGAYNRNRTGDAFVPRMRVPTSTMQACCTPTGIRTQIL